MITKVLLTLALVVAVFAAFPLQVSASDEHDCDHAATVASLRDCVDHHIHNPGIVKSLLAKLDAAHAALDRGQPDVAVNNLYAFIHEVDAQAGKHIDPGHAAHLSMHATEVIAALGQ